MLAFLALGAVVLAAAGFGRKTAAKDNLTFGLNFSGFSFGRPDFSGIPLTLSLSVENASNQTYIAENGYFTLRHKQDKNFSNAIATFKFREKITIQPRDTTMLQVETKITLSFLLLVKSYIAARKGTQTMPCELVGTMSVLGLPSVNFKEDIDLYEYIALAESMLREVPIIKNLFKGVQPATLANQPKRNLTAGDTIKPKLDLKPDFEQFKDYDIKPFVKPIVDTTLVKPVVKPAGKTQVKPAGKTLIQAGKNLAQKVKLNILDRVNKFRNDKKVLR